MRRLWISLSIVVLAAAAVADAPQESSITFVAKNLLQTANGTFHSWRIANSRIDLANPAASSVEVMVDLASVDTGNEDRDEHLRTADFFEVETYPTATVRIHSPSSKGTDDRGRELYAAKFSVDLHGVQKTLDGEFSVATGDPLTIEGGLRFNRLDFGIGSAYRFWNPVSIQEEVPVQFRAVVPAH